MRFAMVVMLFLFVFTHRGFVGQNDLSRFVGVDSLVNRGVFHVDGSPWAQMMVERDGGRYHMMCDMVYNHRDGHLYSSKPPVLTILLAGVLKAFTLSGAEFQFRGPQQAVPTFLLTWLVIGLMTAAAFYAFRRKAGEMLDGAEADVVTLFALGGTLFLAYSTTMNHHTFTAALILISFFLLGMDRSKREIPAARVLIAGCLMGLAVTVDCGPGFVFSVAFGLYLIAYVGSWRTVALFALGSVPALAMHSVLQYSLWGSILPVQMMGRGTKSYPGSYWFCKLGSDIWQIPRYRYWLLTLFSARGLFVLSPVLLAGFAGLCGALRKSWPARRALRSEEAGPGFVALTVLFGMAVLFFYYSFVANTNFCGGCFGFRWYIGFTPLLSYYAARYYAGARGQGSFRTVFYILGLVSLMYALIGMQEPWTLMENNSHPAVRALMLVRGF